MQNNSPIRTFPIMNKGAYLDIWLRGNIALKRHCSNKPQH